MFTKKFFLTVLVVFILLEVFGYITHMVLLSDQYASENIAGLFRSEEDMSSKMWIVWFSDLVWSFFFVFFFAKGYENKGLMEGVRYGIYMGIFWSFVFSYQSFAIYPLPYSMTFQWFAYGFIITIILGIVSALIYKPQSKEA